MPHVIIGSCLNPVGKDRPGAAKQDEYVQIRPDGSLVGHILYQTVDPGTSQERLEPYIVFTPANCPPPSARTVVGHSGTGVPRLDQDGNWHVYNAGQGPTSGRWRLNNGGDTLVLCDSAGREVSRKRFGANHCDLIQKIAVAVGVGVIASGSAAAAYGELD